MVSAFLIASSSPKLMLATLILTDPLTESDVALSEKLPVDAPADTVTVPSLTSTLLGTVPSVLHVTSPSISLPYWSSTLAV